MSLRSQSRTRLLQSLNAVKGISKIVRFSGFSLDYQRLRDDTKRPKEEIPQRRTLRRTGTLLESDALKQEEEEQRRRAHMFVQDDKWEEATTTVFFPVAPGKYLWDYMMLVALVHSIIVEPYRISFDIDAEGFQLALELVLSIVFLTDILLTLNTAYLDGDVWVIDRWMIVNRYLKGRFWIEVRNKPPECAHKPAPSLGAGMRQHTCPPPHSPRLVCAPRSDARLLSRRADQPPRQPSGGLLGGPSE